MVYRLAQEELVIDLPAQWCEYRLHFVWIEDLEILQIHSTLDLVAKDAPDMGELYKLLSYLNERIMLGHFEIPSDTGCVTYRHSLILRSRTPQTAEFLEELVGITLGECERFYPSFQLVILGNKTADEAASVTMIDTVGEA
jgi:hypothetical protein